MFAQRAVSGAKHLMSKQLTMRLAELFAEPTAHTSVATIVTTRRSIASKISNKEISVMSYGKEDLPTASSALAGSISSCLDAGVVHSVLKVRENTDPADAVNDPRGTALHKPVPLNNTIAAMLPNTLQKFLLHGKVAVVTG